MPLPILIRNFEAGPTVFTDITTKEWVDWAGAEDDNGGDVQVVPEAFLNNAKFIQALQRGTFGIENPEDNPDLSARLEKYATTASLKLQRAQADGRRTLSEDQAAANIERTADNDMVVLPCVGPTRAGVSCNADVTVKSSKQYAEPPLCSKHAVLKNEFVPEESWVGRSKVVEWKRVRLGKRERQES